MVDTPIATPSPDDPENASLIEPPMPLVRGAASPPEARGSAIYEAAPPLEQETKSQDSRQGFLWNTHGYINEYIRFSDAKAGVVITLAGALLGLLYSTGAHQFFLESFNSGWSWMNWCSLLSFSLLVVAVLLAVWAVKPRPWSHQTRAFVFWGGIAKFSTPETYGSELRGLSDEELLEHLAHHIFDLSEVCVSKYFWVSVSIFVGVAGGLLAILVVLARPGS